MASAPPNAGDQADANRIWFAILFPSLAGFGAAFVAVAALTRDDISNDPLPALAGVFLASALLTLPAVLVNALVFRRGDRDRGAWLARGVPTAVLVTLSILAVLCAFFWFVRLGMTH